MSFTQNTWHPHYRKAGIKDANVHVLRKTFGSILIQKKLADIFEVSRLLGHSSVRVTEKHYVDLLKENIEKPVQGLTDVIKLEWKKNNPCDESHAGYFFSIIFSYNKHTC